MRGSPAEAISSFLRSTIIMIRKYSRSSETLNHIVNLPKLMEGLAVGQSWPSEILKDQWPVLQNMLILKALIQIKLKLWSQKGLF